MARSWFQSQGCSPHSMATVLIEVTPRAHRKNTEGQVPNSVPGHCPVGQVPLMDTDAVPVTPKPGSQRDEGSELSTLVQAPSSMHRTGFLTRGPTSFHSELSGRRTGSGLKPRVQGWKLSG